MLWWFESEEANQSIIQNNAGMLNTRVICTSKIVAEQKYTPRTSKQGTVVHTVKMSLYSEGANQSMIQSNAGMLRN